MSAFLISIPLTIFVIFVLPIWLWLHYGNKRQQEQQLSATESQRLVALTQQAERMQQRIDTLEAILDAENPQWRETP